MKKGSKQRLWLLAGAIIVGLVLYNLSRSPEWRAFRWDKLWASITQADPRYLLLAVVTVLLTYLLRAVRWQFFLNPTKHASLWVLFKGQVFGFGSIYLVGRPGELVRPAYIAKKENIAFSAMMAVWLLERIFDSVVLISWFAVALYFDRAPQGSQSGQPMMVQIHKGGAIMMAMTGAMIAGLAAFRWRPAQISAAILRMFSFLSPQKQQSLKQFLDSFDGGLEVIRKWRDLGASVLVTVVLWLVNTLTFWLVFRSVGGGISHLGFLSAAVVSFCAAMGLVIQFPGIGGGYQVGILLALTQIYKVDATPAAGAAIITWIVISVPCLLLALVLLLREGLSIRKLEEIAEEEERSAGILEQEKS
jgi:glycosyltransferase 2 family protein